jgi:hypothetical protein
MTASELRIEREDGVVLAASSKPSFRPQRVLTTPSLYYPRFVRVTFTRAS